MVDLRFETMHKLTVICDVCNHDDFVGGMKRGALVPEAKANGWHIVRSRKGGTVTICPTCVQARTKEKAERKASIEAARQRKEVALAEYRTQRERIYGSSG